jgi:hypothetical protein
MTQMFLGEKKKTFFFLCRPAFPPFEVKTGAKWESIELLLNRVTRGRFLNRVQVENLKVANLIGINLFTSSLELEKFSTWTQFKNRPQGPMLWFLKIFSPKKIGEKIGVFDSKQSYIVKKFDHNFGFWEKRHFCQKLAKIVIITSTPDEFVKTKPKCSPTHLFSKLMYYLNCGKQRPVLKKLELSHSSKFELS